MIKVELELDEDEIRSIIAAEINHRYAGLRLSGKDIPIQVKSKQNYKSEWEEAAIRIKVNITKPPA